MKTKFSLSQVDVGHDTGVNEASSFYRDLYIHTKSCIIQFQSNKLYDMIAFPFKRELEMKYKLYVLTLKLTCKLELSCSSQNILAASENISKDTLFSIYKTLYLKIFLANHKKYLDVLKP